MNTMTAYRHNGQEWLMSYVDIYRCFQYQGLYSASIYTKTEQLHLTTSTAIIQLSMYKCHPHGWLIFNWNFMKKLKCQ